VGAPGALVLLLVGAPLLAGCDQVRGRRLIQKGNQQFHDGQYAAAVATFRQAEQHLPGRVAAVAEQKAPPAGR